MSSPSRERQDNSDDNSDDAPTTEARSSKRSGRRRSGAPPSPEDVSQGLSGAARARRRVEARRTEVRSHPVTQADDGDNVNDNYDDANEGESDDAGSSGVRQEAPLPIERARASNKTGSGSTSLPQRAPAGLRGLLRNTFAGGRQTEAAVTTTSTAASTEGDGSATLANPVEEADAEAEATQLALGLTERVPPRAMRRCATDEARLFVRLHRMPGLGWWRRSGDVYAQPVAEMADGLHVEAMPPLSALSRKLHVERLGSTFEPVSKVRRLAPGTVLRQPDPVRHVRVRPSHPGMLADVPTVRPPANVNLVDAASRTSGTKHTMQVSIGLLQLHDHPLFRPEHVLQRRLRTLAGQLGELHQRETLLISQQRVIALRRRLQPYLGDATRELTDEAGRVCSICTQLLQARRQRDEQECAERLLARRMLHVWQLLKNERRQQGFTSTRSKLQVQLLRDDDALETDLEEEVEERRLLYVLGEGSAEGGRAAFDEAAVRADMAERQRSLRRAPGEDVIIPVYTEDTPPTDLSAVPLAERRRQIEAGRVQLYAVLLVDGRVVGTSDSVELHPFDFCARFSSTLQLQLLHAPHVLALQVWQRRLGGLADYMIAEVFLAVPEVASPGAPRWQHYDFATERTFKAADSAGASAAGADGANVDGEVAVVPVRSLCGQVAVSVVWATQPASRAGGAGAAPTTPLYGALTARGDSDSHASGALDTLRVRNHIRGDDLDPNAPQDVPLIALLERSKKGGAGVGFRAFRFGRELQMIKDWLLTDRLQLLRLRCERPHEWQKLPAQERAVPLRDTEITQRMRELLQGGGDALTVDDEEVEADSRQQSKIRAWMKQVLAKQQRAKTGKEFLLSTKDVVKEPLLELEVEPFDLEAFLEKQFQPRRQLRPQQRPRKPEPGSSDVPRNIEVVVVEGVDLPVRSGTEAARTRLFVEVSFQDHSFRTEVKSGVNPIWNQRVKLEMSVPHGDWSQQALMNMSADVSFNLFDVMERTQRDERERNVRTTREEQRWIGSFTLPFSTLYRSGEVKGVFPLAMPPILLGYTKDSRSASKGLAPNSALQLFITIDPLLPKVKSEARERYTAKDAGMQEFATGWIKAIRTSLPPVGKDRPLTVFAPTASGEKALVCRFVRPQPPPPTAMMPNDERTLLRFVHLVPYMDDAALGASLDVWNTTASFLDLCAGDAEEHALLLCNMLLAKGKKAYVVLGNQLPEGETAYVLTRDGGEVRLWDASRGVVYNRESATHPLAACPLSAVGCVFDDNNVWANVQVADRPSEMAWILTDPKCWRPFFGPRGYPQPRTLQSVQAEALEYKRTTEEYRNNLESEIEQRLQAYFEDLRGHRPTDWNRSLGNTLKKLLKRFELDASGGSELTRAEHDAQLERVQATYDLVGFPIHVSYTDVKPLLAKLKNTNMWMSDSPKMQFALTAYVHAYPNNICSVWVYIAALHDRRG